jgi:hypothetical protein
MPIAIPDDLFLRDPRNRAMLEGNRDEYEPAYPDGGPHPAVKALMLVAISIFLGFVMPLSAIQGAATDAPKGCWTEPTIACAVSEPNAGVFLAGGCLLSLFLWTATLVVSAIRFPGRSRRLREEGVITYGKVVECTRKFHDEDSDGPATWEISLQYAFVAGGQQQAHSDKFYRSGTDLFHAPSAGTRVAVLYVDDQLWELL